MSTQITCHKGLASLEKLLGIRAGETENCQSVPSFLSIFTEFGKSFSAIFMEFVDWRFRYFP